MPLHCGTLAKTGAAAPALLVHGGAWAIPEDALVDHRRGLENALALGTARLQAGGAALEVAVAVVAMMEGSGIFDAGCGSVLTRDGRVEMDAGCMCGATLRTGSVIGIKTYAHPIHIAHALLERGQGEVRMLAGEGAEAFADQAGFRRVAPASLVHPREQARRAHLLENAPAAFAGPRGTVGCVARDAAGRYAAATSTGGTPLKPPGRVGDSPLPGAGFFADERGAASFTGWGEAILTLSGAARVVAALAHLPPETAAADVLRLLGEKVPHVGGAPAEAGAIVLGEDGGAWAFTTPRMARAGWSAGGDAFVLV